VTGGSLLIGDATYKTLVVPACQFMPAETFENIINLAKKGAFIIVHNNLPKDIPGYGRLDEKRQKFKNLIQQLNFTEIENDNISQTKIGTGRMLLGENLDTLLQVATVRRENMVNQGLQCIRRIDGKRQLYFVVNRSDTPVDGWVPLQASAQSIAIFDPMTGDKGLARLRNSGKQTDIYLQLPPYASRILRIINTPIQASPFNYTKTEGQSIELKGHWEIQFVKGGPILPSPIKTDTLKSWTEYAGEVVKTFSGTAKYITTFQKPDLDGDAWLLNLARVNESARVIFNGKDLGTCILPPFQIHIPKALMKDENRLEIYVSNLMANRIADLDRKGIQWKKFYNVNFAARRSDNRGEDGLFTASRWLPQASGLIGPVTLTAVSRINP
jgi:hypothetical protein